MIQKVTTVRLRSTSNPQTHVRFLGHRHIYLRYVLFSNSQIYVHFEIHKSAFNSQIYGFLKYSRHGPVNFSLLSIFGRIIIFFLQFGFIQRCRNICCKAVTNIYMIDQYNMKIQTLYYDHPSEMQGRTRRPPKIGKNMIFWHKIAIFHTKYPNNFSASLRNFLA
jgi:hypothetical protein